MTDEAQPRVAQVWDCETTGFPEAEGSEIIELGRYLVGLETLEIHSPFQALAKPKLPIPVETMAVHHIRNEHVKDAPALGTLWRPFWEGCAMTDLVAAHNAKFESAFHNGNGRPWICTYKSALVVWPEAPTHSNQGLRYWLKLDDKPGFDPALAEPPHRALPDAYVTAWILTELLQLRSWSELVEISKWPALLTKLRFGKHRGTPFAEAPLDYLEWITGQDMDEDVKFTAKYWLKRRAAE